MQCQCADVRNLSCGQFVIHFQVSHLVPDVMDATPDTEHENRDIGGAVLGVR